MRYFDEDGKGTERGVGNLIMGCLSSKPLSLRETMELDDRCTEVSAGPDSSCDAAQVRTGRDEQARNSNSRSSSSMLPQTSAAVQEPRRHQFQNDDAWITQGECETSRSAPLLFGEVGGVDFYTGVDLLPAYLRELEHMSSSFVGYQYVSDHTECYSRLVYKLSLIHI